MESMFGMHRPWQDWLGIIIGTLIGLAPWLAGQQDSQLIMWNAVLVGAVVITLASLELSSLQRWEEGAEVACGCWLLASPFALHYADTPLALWHFGLGGALVVLAGIELAQDWHRSDADMARET